MKFKVGQKVKIKHLIAGSNCEITGLYVPYGMQKYSGKIKTVASITSNDTVMLNDCDHYWFSIYMITPIKARIKRK